MAVWLLALALVTPPRHAHGHTRKHAARSSHRHREAISPKRATEIQKALVKAGYLKITTGHWDEVSIAAMKKFQAAHHWQTRYVPDARALLALGLVRAAAPTQIAANGGR